MRALLISANTETMSMTVLPLGLGYVARAIQEAGHSVRIINLMGQTDVFQALGDSIGKFKPEVIGISVRNIDNQSMSDTKFLLPPVKTMISFCRKHTDSPIVIGGAGYSIFPQSSLDYLGADIGIQGEGERAFPELLEKLENKSELEGILGLYLPGKVFAPPKNLFSSSYNFSPPLPEVHLASALNASKDTIWIPFQTRRGCSMNCAYCSTASIEGKNSRQQDLERVLDTLSLYAAAGFSRFFFVDNTFNLPLRYAKSLCEGIIKRGLDISWRCIIYPWKPDEDLIEKMAMAGCSEVSLGFESGSTDILRRMNKKYSPEDVRKVSNLCKKYNVDRMGFLLLGGPGENRETALESLDFADSLELESMRATAGIRIYPQTSLHQEAVKTGLIKPDDNLLFPAFYLAEELKYWLPETIINRFGKRPNWII